MEFDKSRVFTALNADELKIGSKVICANNIDTLRFKVCAGCDIVVLKKVLEEGQERRFQLKGVYSLAYLVSDPAEKKLTEDEKLAEEYAEDFIKDKYGGNRHNAEVQKEKLFLKIGFRDGLKVGRPKWHKVADGDLPPVHLTVLNEVDDKVGYCGDGEWETYSEYYERTVEIEPPVAWCELPKFEV